MSKLDFFVKKFFKVPNTYGTSMMFGIGTRNAKVCAPISFEHLLGNVDGQSWGLAHDGKTYFNGKEQQFCVPFGDHKPSTVGIFFDGWNRTLSFSVNDEPLRVAFMDLNLNQILYPMVSRLVSIISIAKSPLF